MTPIQRARIRRATQRRETDPSEGERELNIVPLLDIVINLMLFLLATSAATMVLAETRAELPGVCATGCRREPGLELSVTVADGAILVASRHGRLEAIPRGAEGHDFAALAARLAEVRAAHPDERAVILSADPMVPYEAIVAAMDAIHGSFEDVRLSAGVR
jgi:biopolymer transport protein ExbD